MALLLIYLLLAIGISFLCSIMEAVLLSTTASYIEIKQLEKKPGASLLYKLKTNIDRPISAILSINTIAHTVGASGVGAQAVKIFGETYFGIISAILTLLILFISEIIPKTIGANFWRNLAIPSAYIIRVMTVVAYPLVIVSEQITRLLPSGGHSESVSREEIQAISSLGAKEGILEKDEGAIMFNAMRLNVIRAKEIMTPRTVVIACPKELTFDDFLKNESYLEHTRIPVYDINIDDTEEYVLKTDVLEKLARGQKHQSLATIARKIRVIPENMNIRDLLEEMITENEHLALVVNEYGSIEGIVSLEDIIETLIGREIIDEKDHDLDKQMAARAKWNRKLKIIYPRFWRS
ncbi:MAG: hemolysin family protein [Prolixibacteraceae bacterium]|jgi:CBS domain containing-hemolysin-like protein|nr:hemolysin family protein [Prolixibacteraceae bacterium]